MHRPLPLFRRTMFDIGLLVCLSLGALYATARIGLLPDHPADGVAVIFAPWTAADQTFSRAVQSGGRFVRYGGFPFIAVVIPNNEDYSQRMLDAGAWLVVDPKVLAACLPASLAAQGQS
jgi:hypothetical protein